MNSVPSMRVSIVRRERCASAWLACLVTLSMAGCNDDEADKPQPPPPDAVVSVQLDVRLSPRSASGFLHGLSDHQPPDRLVAPLRPRLWRSNLLRAPLARVQRLGARYAVALSGLWGYPKEDWRGRGPPWAHPREWERFVRGLARGLRGEDIIWEVWNEPDLPEYWNGGVRRFLRLYALSERILRSELGPDGIVGGPSISRYSRSWLRGFLDSCERAGCRPDFLSWHELLPPDQPIDSVADHLRQARSELAGPAELQVNEYTGPADQYLPGEAVAYLAALEAGGADYAALACWPDSAGGSNCDPGRLGGLIDAAGAPRAVWWAHRWYARGVDTRVESESNDPRVSVLASGGSRALVLLGRGERNPAPEGIDVEVRLAHLPASSGGFATRVERLPDRGEAPLSRPLVVTEEEVDAAGGSLRVRVPDLRPHEAALVTVGAR